MNTMGTAWFTGLVTPALADLQSALEHDPEFKASSLGCDVDFAVHAVGEDDALVVHVDKGRITVTATSFITARFTISAKSEHWAKLLKPIPEPFFQSYWGILRLHGHEKGVGITGDVDAFGKHARLWRIVLDQLRSVLAGKNPQDIPVLDKEDDTLDDEAMIGRYTWIRTPQWGSCRVFYESAGNGPQHVLFLHTAGSDSRQFHALMNNRTLQQRCTMVAFDLPAHGRSSLGSLQLPQSYTNDEENYLAAIAEIIKKVGLQRPIVTGASMAGQISLAVALNATAMDVKGVIPCQACEHLPLVQASYEIAGDLNESILNPERVSGMIGPSASAGNRRLIWWSYSSQGAQIFQGDLKFYFRGWDGRGRVQQIDTTKCPVYMLTGEYDYSCPPVLSAVTAGKIPGAQFEKMTGLGHFPMTEDPKGFLPYFIKALDYIDSVHGGN